MMGVRAGVDTRYTPLSLHARTDAVLVAGVLVVVEVAGPGQGIRPGVLWVWLLLLTSTVTLQDSISCMWALMVAGSLLLYGPF